jgi:two-component system cell cycle response regulator
MPSRTFSLLLVDDDPSAIQVMSRMLEQFPDLRFATSGKAALRLAGEATPDLILLDAEMPGMTGFEVYEELQSDPSLAGVPVIFVTSHDDPAMKAVALHWGAADFVTKPLDAGQLLASVLTQLNARQAALLAGGECGTAAQVAGAPALRSAAKMPRFEITEDDL